MATGHKTELRTSGSQVSGLHDAPQAVEASEEAPASQFSMRDDSDPLIGSTIASRYRVLKKLGEGGMGAVYLAEHIAIEKKVAIKVLLYEFARKEDLKERFLQEAKAAARIGHENIVDITDFGETKDGRVFFVMEALDGEELSDIIKREGAMTWSRAKPIILQICRAIGAAHAKDIVHRDMKPENIFLIEREGRNDFVKILDFGIAKVSSLGEGEKKLTRTGMIFGTPEYMSPEQAQGHKADHRVDIYAVGVIMYEMITGEVPFKADTFMGILTKHIFEHPVPPSQARPDLKVPADVDALIMQAMAKNRDERFQSMSEMAAVIAQSSGRMTRPTGNFSTTSEPRKLSGSGLTFRPDIVRPESLRDTGQTEFVATSKRKKLIAAIVGGLIAVGGVAAAFVFTGGSDKPTNATVSSATTNQVSAAVAQVSQPATDEKSARANQQESSSSTKNDEEKATEQPATKMVELDVDSDPQGAAIYVDGVKQDKVTPTTLSFKQNDRRVVIRLEKDGYLPKEIKGVRLKMNRPVYGRMTRDWRESSRTRRRPSTDSEDTKTAQPKKLPVETAPAKVEPTPPTKTQPQRPSTLNELRQPDW